MFKCVPSALAVVKSARLSIEHTEETIHPMHAFVCESPAVDREILLEGRSDDGVRTLVFYVEGDADAYEAVLAAQDAVMEYDLRRDAEDAFFLYVRASTADGADLLSDTFDRETVVAVPPIEFRSDRTMRLSIVGAGEELQALVETLSEALRVDVLSVGSLDRTVGPALTDRQREALATARALGYYDVPRAGGLEAVAAELDCAVSTASTLLRRAESHLVADALGSGW